MRIFFFIPRCHEKELIVVFKLPTWNARVNDIITQHHTDIHRKVCQNYNIINNIIIISSSISIIINIIIIIIIIIIITSCHADDWLHAFILRIKEIFCRRT